ncbi:protein mono-ADP-ribosyltransferase Parp16 [Drosophila grimshawi]|nr:protein mono-ADP-ribosyltransferase Parp16 [Drosophila grimshawi]
MQLVGYLDSSHTGTSSSPPSWECTKSISLQQCSQIQERLQNDLLACDARLSLFVAAANSYRYESLLRPFPKEFLDDDQRPDIAAILDVVADMERLDTILRRLVKGKSGCLKVNELHLLHAVLVRHGERVAIRTLSECEFDDLFRLIQLVAPQMLPTHIFGVTPSMKCGHTKHYVNLRKQYPIGIGYYGGKLEHLYAMLTMGSLPLDEPLELYCDVEETLKMCRLSTGWGGSRCGAILGCVAVVEYVVLPKLVSTDENRGLVIINDATCMQVCYLMFFGQSFQQYEHALISQPSLSINWNETCKWMEDNRYTLSLGIYMMILSLSASSGRGIFHRFAEIGLYVLRRGFLKI